MGKTTILAARKEYLGEKEPSEGSKLFVCSRCKEDVWLTPYSQKTVNKEPNTEIICNACLLIHDHEEDYE